VAEECDASAAGEDKEEDGEREKGGMRFDERTVLVEDVLACSLKRAVV
jgi:hypothetical protein